MKIRYNQTDKIALCCIAKCENDYIENFVKYYKHLGFDRIFIYDNNDENGEHFEDVLGDYILNGFCEIIDYRGKQICQLDAYQHCYTNQKMNFDWIAFFDCDEFLTFVEPIHIKSFLKQGKFNKYQIIHFNWMNYGDNELIENDGRSMVERFEHPILPYDYKLHFNFPENDHVKSLVRGNLTDIHWTSTPHTPISKYYLCCTPQGIKCDTNSPFVGFDHSVAYIRHYYTKTICEWVLIKQKRGYPDQTKMESDSKLNIKEFFKVNQWTKEKQKIIDRLCDNRIK